MTERDNDVFDLDAQMSFTEIGKRLGITKNSAWKTYWRAMRKLRRPRTRRLVEEMRRVARAKG